KIDTSDTGFTYDESTGLISFYAIDMLGSEYLPNGFDHTFTFEVQIDDFNLIQFSQVVSSSAYDLDGNGVVNGQANAVDLGTISYNDDPFIFNPLSGTYTIDPNGSGANNFTSFTSATVSMDLNGITGAVVFDVKPGVYQETAGGPNGIPQITGASATNTITFQNDGSGGDVVISPVLNGAPNACVYLNGADWLIFDGIDTAPDVNSTQGYYGFYLTGGSENNEIKNCNISSAANNNSNYRAIYQTQTGGLANNSNSYHDNEIHTAYSGIYISGASTNYDTLNTVYKNDIHDVAQHGIYFYYQKTVNLWGNDIHDIGTNSLTYGMNILVSSANTTIEVHDNKIHGIAGSSGRGLHFGGSSSKKLVYNNAIYDFSTTGQNLAMFNAGASSGDEYYYNTIYINETNSTQAAYGFFNNSAQNTIFKNNIIAIEKAQGQAVCQNKPNGTIGDYNNNVYFVDPTNQSASVGIFQGISGQSLLDWQTVSGQDFSSFNADPKFISVTDPHIDPTQYSPADNNGVPIASVTVDIDGDTRDANAPDIGVDEFSGVQLANDVGISGPITLNPSAPTNIDPLILTVTVSNFTATTETFDVVATLDGGSAQGGIDLGVTNLTLVGNADSTISFAWGTPTIGPHLAEIQTTLSNDQFTANDYVSNQFSVAQGATVPFLDTFGVAGVTTLNSDLWPGQVGGNGTGNPAGFITTNAPNPPSPPNAMLINADPTGSDTITSAIFDLSPYSGVFLKFWYQRGGGFEAPDANEFLRTWYLNSNNIWTQVPGGEFVGNSTLETTFTQVDTLLPPDAYHAGFRLRFTANGTVCACDGWAIDDVELVPNNDLKGPNINGLVEFQDTDINDQPFDIWAKITDPSGVDTPSVQLNWKFSTDANYNVIPMTPAPLDSFFAQIPAPNQFDVTIEYYVTATDLDSSMNVTNLPDVPGGFPPYSFDVRLIPAGTLNAQSNVPCSIPLDWGEPGANGIELKYDDGTSEFQSTIPSTPPGLNSPGPAEFASVFDIANQTQIVGDAQINSLRFYVDNNALSASEYKVKVVDFDDVAGTPGTTIIFESPLQTQAGSAGSFVSFDIADPVTGVGPSVGNGKFSIIIEQTTAAKISLGGDLTQQPPFTYVNNTFYIKAVGSAWATLESLGTFYGPSIPMVRCFVEPLIVVAPSVSSFQSQYFKKTIENSQNDIPQFSKASNSVTKSLTTARGSLSKARTNSKVRRTRIERQRTQSIKVNKNSNSISGLSKGSNKINVTPSWAVLGYNLYQLPGSAATSQDVVNTGTMIYTGVLQQFDDTSVMSDSTYSYAVTVNYDVNGTSTESPPGNLVVATTGTCTTGNPNITTTATSVDFGQIPLNTASVQTLQIKNSGNGDLDITSFTPSAPFTIQNPPTLPFTILAGDSAAIDIAVFLTTAGVVNGTLDIGNNTANNNPYTVNLTADGASPDISVSSTFLNFGGQLSFPQGSPVVGADTVTVTNTGSADLTISALNISGTNVNNFAVTNTTPVTVTPNSSVDIIVDLANITATGTYNATLEIVNNAPSGNVFVNLSADILILGIEDLGNAIPTEFSLAPNYPNPFNPTTTIKFGIPEKNFTRVVVYNALGQSVKTLVNETLEASFYELKWDGTDNNGNTVASGIYFARMEAGKFVEIRKMTFLK
ncbi:MAG: choice-of-anchor D domain-containing protein, partial [Calditrichaeota bacterium]